MTNWKEISDILESGHNILSEILTPFIKHTCSKHMLETHIKTLLNTQTQPFFFIDTSFTRFYAVH